MNAVDYIVTRDFTDKESNQTYRIGESYNAQSEQRVQELEGGGFIAPANSVNAKDAMAQAQNAQANADKLAQAHTQAANNAEPKTVVNGKVVPLKYAQAAEAAFDESNRQSGVQQHHDNTSESVPAGQVAQNTQNRSVSMAESGYAQTYNQEQQTQQAQVNQTNVQSGQQQLEQHMQQAQQQGQQQGQQQNMQPQQAEQQALAAAAEKTNPMAAEHETAAEMERAASQARKARAAKKDQ